MLCSLRLLILALLYGGDCPKSDVARLHRGTFLAPFEALHCWKVAALCVVGVVGEKFTINVAQHRIENQGQPAPITCSCSSPDGEDVGSDIRAG